MDPTTAATQAGTQFVTGAPSWFQLLVYAAAFTICVIYFGGKFFENSQSNNAKIRRLQEDLDYQLKRAQEADAKADAAEQRLSTFINEQVAFREQFGEMRAEVGSLRRDNERLVNQVKELTAQNAELTAQIRQFMETRQK